MEININFLIFLTTVIIGINTVILFIQCKAIKNSDKKFFFYWTMGSLFNFMGLLINYGRNFSYLNSISTVGNSVLFFIGAIYTYLGTINFLRKISNKRFYFLYLVIPTLISIYFTYIHNIFLVRTINFSIFMSFMSFINVVAIYKNKSKHKENTIKILLVIFFINSMFFGIKGLFYIFYPNITIYSDSIKMVTYTVFLLCSIIFTFCYNLILNKKFINKAVEGQNNLRAIFNTNPDIFIITKLSDGKIIMANDGFSKNLGFTEEEALGKMTTELNVWVNLEERDIFIDTIKKFSNIENFEITLRKKNLEEITCLISANLINLEEEEHIVSIVRNISNRKILEEKLEESEGFLSEIINNNGALIYAKDLNGKYKLVNKKWKELTGLKDEDVIGKTDLDLFPDKMCRKFMDMELNVLEQGILMEKEESIEIHSEIKHFISIKFPIKDKNEKTNGICGISTEITERKIYEEQIKELAKQLEIERDYAQKNSITDSLTNLYNRRFFDEVLKKEFFRLKRTKLPLSLIMFDIDFFKRYNDTYGHLGGDECLQNISKAVKTIIQRNTDVVTRYGGEEFAIILPETNSNSALKLAEKVRITIENLNIPHMTSTVKKCVTVSLGVATVYKDTITSPEQVITLADIALYNAKEDGRNRTNVAVINLLNSNTSSHINLVWDKNDESGNILIDEEHKTLLNISNSLINSIVNKYPKEDSLLIIKELIDALSSHFSDEEDIFSKTNYPLIENHKKLHEQLIKKTHEIMIKYSEDALTLGEIIDFLVYEVVEQHMTVEDKTFFPYVSLKD